MKEFAYAPKLLRSSLDHLQPDTVEDNRISRVTAESQ